MEATDGRTDTGPLLNAVTRPAYKKLKLVEKRLITASLPSMFLPQHRLSDCLSVCPSDVKQDPTLETIVDIKTETKLLKPTTDIQILASKVETGR